MYHRITDQTRLVPAVVLALGFAFSCVGPCLGKSATAPEETRSDRNLPTTIEGKAIISTAAWSALPSVKDLKRNPVHGVEIYEYDSSPLGDRAPLLMVHGLDGENKQCFRWPNVCKFLEKEPSFNARYKILFARYNTHFALADVVPHFQRAIESISSASGGKPVRTIALSMGGNLIQQAMVDKATSARIDRVLTMGTPFHGSPLFATDWMHFSMAKHYRLPLMRFDNCFPYKVYFDHHKNLLSDLPWDNTDKKIPDIGTYRFVVPYPIIGKLSPEYTANRELVKYTVPGVVDKAKFIVYGGYLGTLVSNPEADRFFRAAIHYPTWFVFTRIPEHCGKEHPVLRVLNEHIAHTITAPADSSVAGSGGNMYGLNDGITPLSSALYLSDAVMESHALRSRKDVPPLRPVLDVRKARVFDNIDHLTFMDGYTPRGRSQQLRDELSPSAPERTIFHWILTDVMDVPDGNQLAAEGTHNKSEGKD